MPRIMTDEVFASIFDCAHKCAMQRSGHHGKKSVYQEHAELFNQVYREAALRRVQARYAEGGTRQVARLTPSAFTSRDAVAVVARAEADGLQSNENVLVRAAGANDAFEPVMFHRYEEILPKTKVLLGYRAVVIGKVLRRMPTHGQIICGREFSTARVALGPLIAKAEHT